MASRKLEDLHPILHPGAATFLAECENQWPGPYIEVIFTCTYRSHAEQAHLYTLGRTVKSHVGPWSAARPLGRRVTNAQPGYSAHNYLVDGQPAALAFDIAVLIGGKVDWNVNGPVWKFCGRIGQDLGLDWYGVPSAPFQEAPHFQHPHWLKVKP